MERGGRLHLLSCYKRQAPRSAIMEVLWVNNPACVDDYLIRATSRLRTLLHDEQAFRLSANRLRYEIADQAHVWVDADHCEEIYREATRIGYTTSQGSALLEEAEACFRRGLFLEEEAGAWAHGQRSKLRSFHYDCLLSLAEAYEVQGRFSQAERVAEILLHEDASDENALCHLMMALHQQGKTSEALRRYQETCSFLNQVGRRCSTDTETLAKRLQQEPKIINRPLAIATSPFSHDASSTKNAVSFSPFSSNMNDIMNEPGELGCNERNVVLEQEIALLNSSIVTNINTMTHDHSKRDALRKIAAMLTIGSLATPDLEPWERLFMAHQRSSISAIINITTLDHFEHLLKISWQFCDANQFDTAEGILASFLPHFLSLPQHEPRIAFLASHSLRLQSIVTHHHLKLMDKVRICEQSVHYARQANDTDTLVLALIELAGAYEYSKQPGKRLIALQEALYHSSGASSLVQSRIYSRHSVVLAESKRVREAQFYIALAGDIFPDDPTKDPLFPLADSSIFRFSYHAGLVCLHIGSIEQAFHAFEQYNQHPSGSAIPERIRLEIANGNSRVAILENDEEAYAYHLENVIIGSLNIGSKKRFDEAHTIFQREMPRSWLTLPHIKMLSEQYHLKRGD